MLCPISNGDSYFDEYSDKHRDGYTCCDGHSDLDPNGELTEFEMFINVSDEYRPVQFQQFHLLDKAQYWFLMGE